MGITITQGDAVAWARHYDGPKFHAMLCDPPYHLTSIVKRFGGSNAAPAQFGKDGAFARASKGFMGKQWDGGDVAFDPATWDAFASVLYPGAFGMAFASSRGWHRLAVAIEDAGLIIHPSIFGWAYGSGFPKATRVDTQIDKSGGVSLGWFGPWLRKYRHERGISSNDLSRHFPSKTGNNTGCVRNWELGYNMPTVEQYNKLVEVLDLPFKTLAEAEREVIGQQTKARKTDSGIALPTTGDTEYQTWDVTAPATDLAKAFAGYRYGLQALKPALEPIIVFQKPYEGRPIDNITQYGAGVLNIDGARIGTEEITIHGYKGDSYSQSYKEKGTKPELDEYRTTQGRWPSNFILLDDAAAQALDRQSGYTESTVATSSAGFLDSAPVYGDGHRVERQSGANDAGGASRFFFRVQDEIDAADPVYYCAKASTDERNAGLDAQNPHPTIKALELCRYLATLLLPPTEYAPRRLFIPFAGVASECIGAMQAGWDEIQGVELTEEYIPIAQARVEYWAARGWQLDMFANSLLQSDVDV